MQPTERQTMGRPSFGLGLVRGDRYGDRPARIFTSGELRLDADMQRLFGDVVTESGRAPTRGFARIAQFAEGAPWRYLARYIVRAARKGDDRTERAMLAITERLSEFVREMFHRYRDERTRHSRKAA